MLRYSRISSCIPQRVLSRRPLPLFGVLVHRGLNHSVRFTLPQNRSLESLDSDRGEKLVACLLVDSGRHVLHDVELPLVFQRLRYSPLN